MALYFNGTEQAATSPLNVNGTGVDTVYCNGTKVWRFAKNCWVKCRFDWSNCVNQMKYGVNLAVIGSTSAAYQISGNTETGIGGYKACDNATGGIADYKNTTLYFNGEVLIAPETDSCGDNFYWGASFKRRKIFSMPVIVTLEAGSDRSTSSARIAKVTARVIYNNCPRNYTHWITTKTIIENSYSSCGEDDSSSTEEEDGSTKARFCLYDPAYYPYKPKNNTAYIDETMSLSGEGTATLTRDFQLLAEPAWIDNTSITSWTGTCGTVWKRAISGTVTFTSGATENFSYSDNYYWKNTNQLITDATTMQWYINRDFNYSNKYLDAS